MSAKTRAEYYELELKKLDEWTGQELYDQNYRVCDRGLLLSVIHEKGFVDLLGMLEVIRERDKRRYYGSIYLGSVSPSFLDGVLDSINEKNECAYCYYSGYEYAQVSFKKTQEYAGPGEQVLTEGDKLSRDIETKAFVLAKLTEITSLYTTLQMPYYEPGGEPKRGLPKGKDKDTFENKYEFRSRFHTFNGLECTFAIGV